eukprot:4447984-Amphidinium_carterae.2
MGMEKTRYLGTLFWHDDSFYEQATERYIAKIVDLMEVRTHTCSGEHSRILEAIPTPVQWTSNL